MQNKWRGGESELDRQQTESTQTERAKLGKVCPEDREAKVQSGRSLSRVAVLLYLTYTAKNRCDALKERLSEGMTGAK